MNVRELPTEREIIERMKAEIAALMIERADLRGNLLVAQREADKWRTLHNEKCKDHSQAIRDKNKRLRAYKSYVLVLTGRETLPRPIV